MATPEGTTSSSIESPVVGASPGVVQSAEPTASPAPAGCPSSPGADAEIYDFEFGPARLTIPLGTTVTWMNEGPSDHTVTADDGSFDSDTMAQGATFEHTFDAAGTFTYFCEIHPSMTGTVAVR